VSLGAALATAAYLYKKRQSSKVISTVDENTLIDADEEFTMV